MHCARILARRRGIIIDLWQRLDPALGEVFDMINSREKRNLLFVDESPTEGRLCAAPFELRPDV